MSDSIRLRARFSTDAPLVTHHLVRIDGDRNKPASILESTILISQRIVAYITGDSNRYDCESSSLVEYPVEDVSQVILDNGFLERLLRMVDNHGEFLNRRQQLAMGDGISYGSTLAILEYGPPGTGKTLLARALAHRLGKPMVSFQADCRWFDDNAIQDLFQEARLLDGIVFIDECESICCENASELPTILRELEHFDGIVIMATNQLEEMAPQLDRRFVLKVPFALPSLAARKRIWELHLGRMPLADDVDLQKLARDYAISGGYIKNAVLAAGSEALASGSLVPLSHADLDAACGLQEQHIAAGSDRIVRYRPQVPTPEAADPDLNNHLVQLARSLNGHSEILQRWGLPESISLGGIRILFHGRDYLSALAAADTVAARMERRVLRFPLFDIGEGDEDWQPKYHVEAAGRTGQIVLLADPHGAIGKADAEKTTPVEHILNLLTEFNGIVFVVSGSSSVRASRSRGVFHHVVSTTAADVATRERQWRMLIGECDKIDVSSLAAGFDAHPGQIRMALQVAALKVGHVDDPEPTTDLLASSVRDVIDKSPVQGLFG